MPTDELTSDMILTTTKLAISEGFSLDDLFNLGRWAASEVVKDGYVFDDYLEFQGELDYYREWEGSDAEWDALLAKAFKNMGLDYRAEVRARARCQKRLLDALKEMMASSNTQTEPTVDEMISWALDKNPDRQCAEDSTSSEEGG